MPSSPLPNPRLQVLEQLLDENDSDPNVWLLLAMCCQGGGDLEAALSAGECCYCVATLELVPDHTTQAVRCV